MAAYPDWRRRRFIRIPGAARNTKSELLIIAPPHPWDEEEEEQDPR
jgi:hypothetical protein